VEVGRETGRYFAIVGWGGSVSRGEDKYEVGGGGGGCVVPTPTSKVKNTPTSERMQVATCQRPQSSKSRILNLAGGEGTICSCDGSLEGSGLA
jgi:hypothetical protein